MPTSLSWRIDHGLFCNRVLRGGGCWGLSAVCCPLLERPSPCTPQRRAGSCPIWGWGGVAGCASCLYNFSVTHLLLIPGPGVFLSLGARNIARSRPSRPGKTRNSAPRQANRGERLSQAEIHPADGPGGKKSRTRERRILTEKENFRSKERVKSDESFLLLSYARVEPPCSRAVYLRTSKGRVKGQRRLCPLLLLWGAFRDFESPYSLPLPLAPSVFPFLSYLAGRFAKRHVPAAGRPNPRWRRISRPAGTPLWSPIRRRNSKMKLQDGNANGTRLVSNNNSGVYIFNPFYYF